MPSLPRLACTENINLITINKTDTFFLYGCASDEYLLAVDHALTSDEVSCTWRTSVNEIFVLRLNGTIVFTPFSTIQSERLSASERALVRW